MGFDRAFLSMAHMPRRMGEQEVLEMLSCRARAVVVVDELELPPPPTPALSTMMDLKGDAPDHIEDGRGTYGEWGLLYCCC